MKTTTSVTKRIGPAMSFLGSIAILLSVFISSASANHLYCETKAVFRDTILVQKQQISKKYKIKLYPNTNHQVLFFNASGEAGKVYQLFLFDIDGKLVRQVNILNKQTTVLNKIEKGNYLFEVFSDDERIENGKVIVK